METATPDAPAAPSPAPAPAAAAPPAQAPAQTFLGSPTPAQDTPSFAPSPVFGGHVDDSGQFKEGWTEHVRAGGYETLAGKLQMAKDEKGALKILDDSLKLASRRELKGMPNESWQEHEVAEFRRAHGVPEEPVGYQFKPEKLPDGVQWDDNLGTEFAKLAHSKNYSQEQAKAAIDFHLQQVAAQGQQGQAAIQENLGKLNSASEQEFRKEWGSDFNDRIEANKAFVNVRFTPEELADPLVQTALSHPKIVRMVDEARRGLREGTLPGATHAAVGSQSPQQQAESMMKANPGWSKDPAASAKIYELQALQAQMNKRR